MWLTNVRDQVGDEVTSEQLEEFLWSTLKSGQVRDNLYVMESFSEQLMNNVHVFMLTYF